MPALGQKIVERLGRNRRGRAVDEHKLYLHSLPYHILYVYRSALSDGNPVLILCEPREIGSQLDEYPVVLHAAHDTRYGLTYREASRILLPSAEQLLVRYVNPAALAVNALYNTLYPVTYAKSVTRVSYTRY